MEMQASPMRKTFPVLGVSIDALQIPEVIGRIERWIAAGEHSRYITLTNVHAVMEAHRDESFRCLLNQAAMVCPDGMPLIWLGRLHGFSLRRRVYGPDLLWDFCRATQDRGYKHYFYGGAPGVADNLAAVLQRRFPGVHVVGCYSPPYRSLTEGEKHTIVQRINAAAPNVLWVGLGCPKQEHWMHDYCGLLRVPVMLGVGQAFDIYAGNLRQAPKWMREHGFEWLFRLALEPRRLWRRYLVYNTGFLLLLIRDLLIQGETN